MEASLKMLFIWVKMLRPPIDINNPVKINLYLYVRLLMFIIFIPFVISNEPVINGCFIGKIAFIVINVIIDPSINNNTLIELDILFTRLNSLGLIVLLDIWHFMFRLISPIIMFDRILHIIRYIVSCLFRYVVIVMISSGLYSNDIEIILLASSFVITLLSSKSFIYLALVGLPLIRLIKKTYDAYLLTLNSLVKIGPNMLLIMFIKLVLRIKSLIIMIGKILGNTDFFHKSIPIIIECITYGLFK